MFDITKELDELDISWQSENGKIKCLCPFHDDTNPSLRIDPHLFNFRCFVPSCGASGEILILLSRLKNITPVECRKYIQQKYGVSFDKTFDPIQVEEWHQKIWDSPLKQELYNRCITDDLITQYRLGVEKDRITIPIYNEAGYYCNIRKHKPGAPGHEKTRGVKGYNINTLYPWPQLNTLKERSYKKLFFTGGEIKALAAIPYLNPHEIICLSGIAGEGNFDLRWIEIFEEHGITDIYICFDIDPTGRKETEKLCHLLSNRFNVYDVDLSLVLDIEKYPKGDVNDYLGLDDSNLFKLLSGCSSYSIDTSLAQSQASPENIALSQAYSGKYVGKRTKFKGIISSISDEVYLIPKKVCIDCDRQQDECGKCPIIYPAKLDEVHTLHPELPVILESLSSTKRQAHFALGEALKIPASCTAWKALPQEHFTVEDVRISQELEITNRNVDRNLLPAIIVRNEEDVNYVDDDEYPFDVDIDNNIESDDSKTINDNVKSTEQHSRSCTIEPQETYTFVGRTWPHPKTQAATVIISEYENCQDILSKYKDDHDSDNLDKFNIFQPTEWTVDGLQNKLDQIYEDLEANVTRIYKRRDLHLATDLTYFSPLFFEFDGKLENGWVQTLIVGDSATGKTSVTEGLYNFYGLGDRIDCGSSTAAGVLSATLPDSKGKWYFVLGKYPAQDRRLLIIEEYKACPKESRFLPQMREPRSSGVLTVTKARTYKSLCRTRLIINSNPDSDRQIETYNYGMDTIKELIVHPEDIRRFDFAIITTKNDISVTEIQNYRPEVSHKFTSELNQRLILWTWTNDSIQFEDEQHVLDQAANLCETYSETFPLVSVGSMRLKIARLAAALAARTWSVATVSDEGLTPEGQLSILVRRCHVDYICQFLDEQYSKPTFGYRQYSEHIKKSENIKNPETILEEILKLPFPKDFIENLLLHNSLDVQSLMDFSGADISTIKVLISLLTRYRAFKRGGKQTYYKQPAFTQYLKKWESNGVLKGYENVPQCLEEGMKENG